MNEMLQFSMSYGGALLFAIVFLEQVGLPIPAAPWLLAAGAVCAAGDASPAMAAGATLMACLLADSAWFCLGRRSGKRVLHFLYRLILTHRFSGEQIERAFARHGMPLVVLAKFVPGLSVVVPPLAGALKVVTSRFLLFDLLGSALYAAFYLLLGGAFRNQIHAVMALLHHFGVISLIFLLLLFAAYVAWKQLRRRQIGLGSAPLDKLSNIQQPISLC